MSYESWLKQREAARDRLNEVSPDEKPVGDLFFRLGNEISQLMELYPDHVDDILTCLGFGTQADKSMEKLRRLRG